MSLGLLHARQVAKALEAKALERKVICPDCQREVEPHAWSFHRRNGCRPAAVQAKGPVTP